MAEVLRVSGKSRSLKECMVADAVAVELVSASKFPANREIYREFCRIRPSGANSNVNKRANSDGRREIPYAKEQGTISTEQRVLFLEHGNISAKFEIVADRVFGTHKQDRHSNAKRLGRLRAPLVG
jgi:hypothetical protein